MTTIAPEAGPILRTVPEATAALTEELAGVAPDNPVHAVRRIASVARRCRLPADSSWEAFRWAAEKAVRPFFQRRNLPASKAATWAVVSPYFGQLGGEAGAEGCRRSSPPRARNATAVSVAGGAR